MIRLKGVNKYFNKRKKNEIHVINDTTLEFPSKGLVALLGPSGCGKTTLLNAIGGLDKISKGEIFVNEERLTGRNSRKIDRIRNANVGYIFQNYNLIDNMTVSDNVAIVLKMIGIKDKKEIKEKVEYALDLVGMYRYRNRFADMLSGGERQRVAIARAIVKNPSIIIADEPTGNLDSKNTLEVMNIIKRISDDKLVIMVTHEEKLAGFYGDRIIRLVDGRVASDEENKHEDNLDYRLDNRIYLKDIQKEEAIRNKTYEINLYGQSSEKIELQIVAKDDNIYLKCLNPNKHMEVVDENSPIEIIDDHYKEMTKEEYEKHRFDISKLQNNTNGKHSSILGFFPAILQGFKTVREYPVLKKMLLLGFFISAIFIAYATSNIFGVTDIKDSKFVEDDKDYLRIRTKAVSVKDYKNYEKEASIDYLLPGDGRVSLALNKEDYLQTSNHSSVMSGSLSDVKKVKKEELVAGRLPKNKNEIVVDKLVLDRTLSEDSGLKQAGVAKTADLLGEELKASYIDPLTIVGVTDNGSPCIYSDESLFMNLMANSQKMPEEEENMEAEGGPMASHVDSQGPELVDVSLVQKDIKLEKGRMPKETYEVMVNKSNEEAMPLNKEIQKKINGKKLVVVGYYSAKGNYDYKVVTPSTIEYDLIKKSSNITVMPKDNDQTITALQEKGLNVIDTYKNDREKYTKQVWSMAKASVIMGGIIVIISLIEIFLIIRASFLSRIKEIGTLRAIGVKKSDIYKSFMGEILAITLFASTPGYILMAYIMGKLANISYLKDMFLMNTQVFSTGLILIFAFNIIVGLLPVFGTMRKTPAAILARTDVN